MYQNMFNDGVNKCDVVHVQCRLGKNCLNAKVLHL